MNRVGEVAEQSEITTWAHKIDGLTESDFTLAAKIEELPRTGK